MGSKNSKKEKSKKDKKSDSLKENNNKSQSYRTEPSKDFNIHSYEVVESTSQRTNTNHNKENQFSLFNEANSYSNSNSYNNTKNNYSSNNSNGNSYSSYTSSNNTVKREEPIKTKKISSNSEEDFNLYCNKNKIIDEDGMVKMGEDLGIDIYTDMFLPYFLYKCKAKKLEEITLQEYKSGLLAFNVSCLRTIPKSKLTSFKNDITKVDFQNFYQYLFQINLQKNSKVVIYDVVEVYFKELFAKKYSFVNEFLQFLKNDKKNTGLNKDQWSSFLDLLKSIGNKKFEDFYNMNEAWPVLFDDFYLFYCEQRKIEPRRPKELDTYNDY